MNESRATQLGQRFGDAVTPLESPGVETVTVVQSHSLLAMVLASVVILLGVYWIPLSTLAERSTLLIP